MLRRPSRLEPRNKHTDGSLNSTHHVSVWRLDVSIRVPAWWGPWGALLLYRCPSTVSSQGWGRGHREME